MADKIVEVLKEAYDLLNPAKEQEEGALDNFRTTFPAVASRQIRHSYQRQMLRHLPYPIKESWTHDFCCLPFIDQKKTPSSTQIEQLIKAGLGKTKIVFPDKTAKHHEFCHILENNFPQLKEAGGYNLYRAKAGGQNRDIFKLNYTWYNIPDIRKEVTVSACIYIKPLQKDLNLQRKPVSRIADGPTTVCQACDAVVPFNTFEEHRKICKPENKLRVRLIFLKCCCENLSFRNFMLDE